MTGIKTEKVIWSPSLHWNISNNHNNISKACVVCVLDGGTSGSGRLGSGFLEAVGETEMLNWKAIWPI